MSQQRCMLYRATFEGLVEENNAIVLNEFLGQTRSDKARSSGNQDGFAAEWRGNPIRSHHVAGCTGKHSLELLRSVAVTVTMAIAIAHWYKTYLRCLVVRPRPRILVVVVVATQSAGNVSIAARWLIYTRQNRDRAGGLQDFLQSGHNSAAHWDALARFNLTEVQRLPRFRGNAHKHLINVLGSGDVWEVRDASKHSYTRDHCPLFPGVVVQEPGHFDSFAQKHLSCHHSAMRTGTNNQEALRADQRYPPRLALVENAAG